LSVEKLPEDLTVVIPLPPPIGGALLVGDDELIHVAQSGKAVGVATNAFGAQRPFPMADQSYLNLGLEDSTIAQLSIETGELLLVHNTGQLYIIRFKLDGRTVSGISLEEVPEDRGGSIIPSQISCLTNLDKHTYFVGSSTGDSFVMGWSRKNTQAGKKKSRVFEESLEYDLDDVDLEDDDDDDLYGESAMSGEGNSASEAAKDGDFVFRIHETMMSIAPIREMTSGTKSFFPDSEENKNSAHVTPPLQICAVVGRGKAGALAVLNRQLLPKVTSRFSFPEARDMWTMTAQKPVPKALQGEKGVSAVAGNVGNDYMAGQYDNLMIVAKVDLDGYETSDVYVLTPSGFEHLTGTEFDPAAGLTLEAGTMGKHSRVIQVLKSEVRVYDGGWFICDDCLGHTRHLLITATDLKLQQIVPMLDDETGAEPRVVRASIVDPYLLIIRDDSSVWMAQIDSNGEVEEMDRSDEKLTSSKWLSGCLYADTDNHFNRGSSPEKPIVLAFLVNAAGTLYVSLGL
jgi:cleavage and polyadenylation specificity factor subunit 1